MESKKRKMQQLLVKYLKKTGRKKTLKELLLDIEENDKKLTKVSLSFAILKAPKMISIEVPKNTERKKKSVDKKKVKKTKGNDKRSGILNNISSLA